MSDEEIKPNDGLPQDPTGEEILPKEKPKETPPAEDDSGVVKDDAGVEYVPKKAFDARIGKLTAEKKENAEAAELLKSIDSDPDIRQQFIEKYGLNKVPTKIDDLGKSKYQSTWAPYVNKQSKESQGAMREFEQALGPEIEQLVQRKLDKQQEAFEKEIVPLRTAFGEQHLEKFLGKVPEAKPYLPKIQKLMARNPNLSLEQAYGASAGSDMFKKGKDAQLKEVETRKIKLSKTPISKSGDGKQIKGSGKMNFDEGIRAALDQHRE